MTIKSHSVNKSGQAIAEYLILTALIAVASIGVLQILGANLRSRLTVISEALRGEKRKLSGYKAEEKHFEIMDLGNFDAAIEDKEND